MGVSLMWSLAKGRTRSRGTPVFARHTHDSAHPEPNLGGAFNRSLSTVIALASVRRRWRKARSWRCGSRCHSRVFSSKGLSAQRGLIGSSSVGGAVKWLGRRSVFGETSRKKRGELIYEQGAWERFWAVDLLRLANAVAGRFERTRS